jgi:hypothetical protein
VDGIKVLQLETAAGAAIKVLIVHKLIPKMFLKVEN